MYKNRRLEKGSKSRKRRTRQAFNNKSINPESIVTNLSTIKLTLNQSSVLEKGLTFVNTYNKISYQELDNDVKRFERKLQLHFTFHKNDEESTDSPDDIVKPIFESNPTWWPKKLNCHITAMCYKIKKELAKLNKKSCKFSNISKAEKKALTQLHKNNEIIIKKADKNAGIVILNTKDYKTKILEMLNDEKVYQILDVDDTLNIKLKSDSHLNFLKSQGFINEKQYKFLTEYDAKCPTFYGCPKIHKTGIPLRPIVSQINGPTYRLNLYIHELLETAEGEIPELFKDTTAFLNCIERNKRVEPNTLLVTLDVVSLYTNIPHEEAVQLICEQYNDTLDQWLKYSNQLRPISANELSHLLLFILKSCTFEFNNIFYSQLYGTPMGAPASVRIANIFMYKLLKNFFTTYRGPKPPFIGRLIDDIFTTWKFGKLTLLKLVEELNKFHKSIKFEVSYSDKEVHFLDTTVYIKNGEILTKLYTKPTDRKQYLHYTSAHPTHVKKAIPYSQALRFRRITCEDDMLRTDLLQLQNKLIHRGYPQSLVDSQIDRVWELDRLNTLKYKTKEQRKIDFEKFTKGGPFLPFIITYSSNYVLTNDKLLTVLNRLWSEFTTKSIKIKEVFEGIKPQIVYKRGKTTASTLISAKFPPPWISNDRDDNITLVLARMMADNTLEITLNPNTNPNPNPNPRVSKCGHPRCKCCIAITETTSFESSTTAKIYSVKTTTNCNTQNIVYLITCSKCRLQYVGETGRSLKDRLNNHRSDIKLKKTTAVALHFNDVSHKTKNLQISIIEHFPGRDDTARKTAEKFWIKELKTIYPKGLNYYPLDKQ